jgi:hypothetical protein
MCPLAVSGAYLIDFQQLRTGSLPALVTQTRFEEEFCLKQKLVPKNFQRQHELLGSMYPTHDKPLLALRVMLRPVRSDTIQHLQSPTPFPPPVLQRAPTQTGSLAIPPTSQFSSDGSPFECPFCREIFSKRSERAWR